MLEYYKQSDPENLKNMLLYILREYCNVNIGKITKPVKMPKYGLYHPYKGIYKDLEEYKSAINFKPELDTVGILFYYEHMVRINTICNKIFKREY
ncbi:MAG: cobaltochelatase subunit CobN [Methanothermobacter tenebrarum]